MYHFMIPMLVTHIICREMYYDTYSLWWAQMFSVCLILPNTADLNVTESQGLRYKWAFLEFCIINKLADLSPIAFSRRI